MHYSLHPPEMEIDPPKTLYSCPCAAVIILIILMYIYHVLIDALSAHMIHINPNTIFYTEVENSPTETIYISSIIIEKNNNNKTQ